MNHSTPKSRIIVKPKIGQTFSEALIRNLHARDCTFPTLMVDPYQSTILTVSAQWVPIKYDWDGSTCFIQQMSNIPAKTTLSINWVLIRATGFSPTVICVFHGCATPSPHQTRQRTETVCSIFLLLQLLFQRRIDLQRWRRQGACKCQRGTYRHVPWTDVVNAGLFQMSWIIHYSTNSYKFISVCQVYVCSLLMLTEIIHEPHFGVCLYSFYVDRCQESSPANMCSTLDHIALSIPRPEFTFDLTWEPSEQMQQSGHCQVPRSLL